MTATAALTREPAPRPARHYTEPEFADIAGVPTAYRRKGEGETVLFLHGAGLTRMWLPFYQMMSRHFDFIAPEHPGFGETPTPFWLKGLDDVVLHYDEFLHVLDLDHVHLVGFSLGGWIAAELAATYPRTFQSLTLISPLGLRVDWQPLDDIFQVGPEALWGRLFADEKRIPEFAPDPHDLDEIIHLYGEGATFARLAWTPRYNIQLNRRLGRVTAPSLVVLPKDDRLVPEKIGELYAETLPNARLERVADAGHALIAEQPEEAARIICAHVKGATHE